MKSAEKILLSPEAIKTWLLHHTCIPITESRPLLLAVSGGLDSMVLWWLVHESKLPYSVAHVNYMLRHSESDEAEQFIHTTAVARKVQVHLLRHSLEGHQSGVQALARDIRREFFETLSDNHASVALAHHANDQVETLLMRLARGSSAKALGGIGTVTGIYLRPLLSVAREELEAFAKTHHIAFLEDSSNARDKYMRNRIRHHVIPNLISAEPRTLAGFGLSAKLVQEMTVLAQAQAHQLASDLQLHREASSPNLRDIVDREKLRVQPGLRALLDLWLEPRGFPAHAITTACQLIQDDQAQKRQVINRGLSERLIIAGQRVYLESMAHLPEWSIPLTAVGQYASPIGQLQISEIDAEYTPGEGKTRLLVATLKQLTWHSANSNLLIHESREGHTKLRRILSANSLAPAEQHLVGVISRQDKAIAVPGIRVRSQDEGEKLWQIEFRPNQIHGYFGRMPLVQ